MTRSARSRGSALSGVLIALGVAVLLIAIVVAGAMFGWNRVTEEVGDLSEEGVIESLFESASEPEVQAAVDARQDLIAYVEAIIASESTRFQTAAKLEQLELPDDVLYLALTREVQHQFEDDVTEIAKRLDWSGRSISLFNGNGTGTLYTETGDVSVIVVERDVADRDFADEWVMYLKDARPASPDPAK